MRIGIPRPQRDDERRVALTPGGVKSFVRRGHPVWVESGAGAGAGHRDEDYEAAGATIGFSHQEVFARADLLTCVSTPGREERELMHADQVISAFWLLPAARREDIVDLASRGVTAIGLEAIQDGAGNTPVLTLMSEIAGGLAPFLGAALLLNEWGGHGILFGGAPGIPAAEFVVLGAGILGCASARTALGMGAAVTLLDVSLEKLRAARRELGPALTTMLATRSNLEKALAFADLVLGAVAVHGERAPVLITRDLLRRMRPRAVILDLAIDMGGCCETSRPTRFPDPVYEVDGIRHFCVPNLPSLAARSASLALTNVTLPYLERIADLGLDSALAAEPGLARGTYLYRGGCAAESLARAFGLPLAPLPGAAS